MFRTLARTGIWNYISKLFSKCTKLRKNLQLVTQKSSTHSIALKKVHKYENYFFHYFHKYASNRHISKSQRGIFMNTSKTSFFSVYLKKEIEERGFLNYIYYSYPVHLSKKSKFDNLVQIFRNKLGPVTILMQGLRKSPYFHLFLLDI